MKDPTIDKIRSLLPELYPAQKSQPAPGKMCTPESGCGPAKARAQADMFNVVTGSKPGPPAAAEPMDQIIDSDEYSNLADLLFSKKTKR